MQQPSPLCEYCARIPLNPDALNSERDGIGGWLKFSLGAGSRIKNSSCPFCCLVLCLFSEDFMKLQLPGEVEILWSRGPGRRQALQALNSQGDAWIGFSSRMGPHHDDHNSSSNGYFIEPWTGPVVDTSRVLRWISSCEQSHGPRCAIPTNLAFAEAFSGLHILRLIDVETHCLVEKTSLERYVALSYVWGAVSNFRLTKAKRAALLTPGSLNKASGMLPNTIKDAIAFVKRLGCRYLWVDALCLLQNDAEDLELGVNVMDLIYERAWLTIAASCGHDANTRLPGVQEGTRNASYNTVEVIPGVEMGIIKGLDGLLRRSVYDSRAWTFQEQVLSRRVLYFIDNKVFYRCRAAEHAEHFADVWLASKAELSPSSMLPLARRMAEPEFDFRTMLVHYTKRALTNQNDALRAMAGVNRRMAEAMKCHFFQGLPTAMFDRFIIFYAYGPVLHRRPSFPSYSWTGWRGPVDAYLHPVGPGKTTNKWLENRTWIVWYKRSPSGIIDLVWDPNANPSFPFSDIEYVGYRSRRGFSDSRYIPSHINTRRTMPSEQVSFSRTVPSYPLLQFWTLALSYKIFDIDVFKATGHLEDSRQRKCGFAWLDGFEETSFFESPGPFEVILLSEAYSHPLLDYGVEEWRDPTTLAAGQWTYYNILILEWQDGIAERRGFGILQQGAVEFSLAPGPTWKEIFLA